MNGESDLSAEITATVSRNVSLLDRSGKMDVLPAGGNHDVAPSQSLETHEVVDLQYSSISHSSGQDQRRGEKTKREPRPKPGENCDTEGERRSNPPSHFLGGPLSSFWRRLKWGLILSIGRNDSFSYMKKEDMKAAVATQLEVAIMGSALVLTLCLQIQEVVGSRGGFTLQERVTVRFIFVSSSALSFSFAFYSIITSAMMLLSINAVPQECVLQIQQLSCAEGFLTTLSSWSAMPRLCTLAGALFLGIAALTAFFLGLEHSAAWVGAVVVAAAILLTVASTIRIFVRVKRLQAKAWEEARDSSSAERVEPVLDIENNVGFQRKFRDVSDPSLSSPVSQPVLTPLSSLTNTTGFSIRASRFHQ